MGLFDVFKKSNENKKEEKLDDLKSDDNKNESIKEDANYMLSSVTKKDINDNSLSVYISDLVNINDNFNEYYNAFSNNKKNKNDNILYQISGLNGAQKIIDFFNDPNNKGKVKNLKKLGFNPATIMMTIALSEIEKDVNEIKEISKKILTFLESESEAKNRKFSENT